MKQIQSAFDWIKRKRLAIPKDPSNHVRLVPVCIVFVGAGGHTVDEVSYADDAAKIKMIWKHDADLCQFDAKLVRCGKVKIRSLAGVNVEPTAVFGSPCSVFNSFVTVYD